jgi:hypothetical protein
VLCYAVSTVSSTKTLLTSVNITVAEIQRDRYNLVEEACKAEACFVADLKARVGIDGGSRR